MLKQFGVVKQLFRDPLLKSLKNTIVFDNFGIQKLDPLMLQQLQDSAAPSVVRDVLGD